MEDDQQFCLRWNNHQSTIIQNFDTLLESGTLVDCTLAAEGKYLKAHKVVLSACSPYFEGLLSEHYDKHPVFILKDVKFKELKAMMDYMYRGEVNISQDQLTALLKAAESLQIKGLSDSRTDKGTGNTGNTTTGGSKDNTRPAKTASSTAAASASAAAVDIPHSSSGLTIEKNSKVPRQSIQQVSVSDQLENSASPQLRGHSSREGSQSPTRKRKRLRRRSLGNDDNSMENHEASNSSDVNMTAPALGVAPVAAEEKNQADPADSIGRSALMQQLTKPADEMLQMPLEKPEPSEDMIQPKSEYQDDQESVEDLTHFDDDMNDLNEMEQDNSRAGPSHDPSQHGGIQPWHIAGDRSNASVVGAAAGPGAGDEVFLAAAEAAQAQRDSQVTVANKSAADADKNKTPIRKKPGPLSRTLKRSKVSPEKTETGPSIEADKTKKPTEETVPGASTDADKNKKKPTEEMEPGTSTDVEKNKMTTKETEPATSNVGGTGECIFIKTEVEYSSEEDEDNDVSTEDDSRSKASSTSDPLATNWAMVYCVTCKVLSEYVRMKTKRNCTTCQNPLYYQCTRCKKCLSTLQCLQTHVKVHEREEHKCDHCDFRTANKNVLEQHLETRHVTRGPFGREECPKCKRTYKSRKLMLLHNKRCGVTPEIKCGFCPYMAKTIMILRDHVKKRHIGKEESICECGKKFTNKKFFERHQQNCEKAVPKK